jgi:hypothetical protein
VFDASTSTLRRSGIDTTTPVYRQNAANFEPRAALAWVTQGGRTVVRAGFAVAVQQPSADMVLNLSANPPFGVPLTVTGLVRLDDAIQSARAAGLAPFTVQPDYRNGSVQSWDLTVGRDLPLALTATVGYAGSRGRDLPIVLNINQPAGGDRPFPALSTASPILPGADLGNILEAASEGQSSYHALSLTLTRRLARRLALKGAYVLSSSRDFNSLSSPPNRVVVQDSVDPSESIGPSDFDARHRIVASGTYVQPLARGAAWTGGWLFGVVLQAQSGSPVNPVTTTTTVNGTANTLRPDLVGPIRIVGAVDRWFDTSAFAPVARFGNLQRNAVRGPGFVNVDASLAKTVPLGPARGELRVDVFNALNHPNFGSPGAVVGSPNFGRITSTRFPVGDVGSSRQVQLAASVRF